MTYDQLSRTTQVTRGASVANITYGYYPTGNVYQMTHDAAGTADDVNLYAYTGNNPANLTDPLGLSAKASSSQGAENSFLNNVQNGLDAVGLVGGAFLPGLADLADVVNAGISAARGDWVGAGLSLGAAIPVFGTVIGSGKSVLRNVRTLDALAYGASQAAPKMKVLKRSQKGWGLTKKQDRVIVAGSSWQGQNQVISHSGHMLDLTEETRARIRPAQEAFLLNDGNVDFTNRVLRGRVHDVGRCAEVACFDGLIRSGVSADDIALSEAYRNGNPMERCPWCKLSGF